MTAEERETLERLERRVALLETMVRKLIDVGRVPDPASSRAERLPGPAVHPATRSSFPSRTPAAAKPAAARPDLEQWVGQRGLLIVGVLALLAATGFFLKYAFDHRWIPPALRSAGAVLSGVGLGIWGDRLISRGIRRYGAAMIGGGGGLVYLGLWAAAGPYALVDRRAGVLLLAAATVAVALLALRHEVEGLALWAVLGAYLAPVLLPPPVPNPEALLGYLEVIGLGLALLAFMMSWRRAFDLALGGYLVMAVAGAGAVLGRPLGVWFLASGTLLTLHVTSRRPWPEARLGVVVLSWVIFASHFPLSQASQGTIWLALAAPAAVSALLWWQHFQTDPFAARVHGVPGAMADAGLCVASPFVLSLLARAAAPTLLDPVPAALPAAIGVLHGGVGWVQRRAGFLMLGIALLATAIATQWSAWATVVAWTGLTLAALAAHRWAARPGARTAALGLAALTFIWLFVLALAQRPAAAPAFGDSWALALGAYVAGIGIGAYWWRAQPGGADPLARGGEVLWSLFGFALLVGGSIELHRFFGARTALAGDLALSIYWLGFSGVLVRLGFRLGRKDVRSAGLAVAAGAGLKVVLYDLSMLSALYRIASFLTLALVTLAVAYAYNRRGGVSRESV